MSTPDEMEALIAEARRWDSQIARSAPKITAALIEGLADALEATLSAHPAEEVEWEYEASGKDRNGSRVRYNKLDPEQVPVLLARGFIVHRRTRAVKAGPWEPVPGD